MGKASRRRKAKREARDVQRRKHLEQIASKPQPVSRGKDIEEPLAEAGELPATVDGPIVITEVMQAKMAEAQAAWDRAAAQVVQAHQLEMEALKMAALQRYPSIPLKRSMANCSVGSVMNTRWIVGRDGAASRAYPNAIGRAVGTLLIHWMKS